MINNNNICRLFSTINNKSINNQNNIEISLLKSVGTFININGMDYILSCFHGLNPLNDDITVFYNDNKQMMVKKKCKLISFCEEYDIALLQVYKTKQTSEITLNNFIQSFLITNPKYNITMFSDIDNPNNSNYLLTKELVCENIIFEKYNGFLCPPAPYVVMNTDNLKEFKLEGLSGSLIYNNQHILGMIAMKDLNTGRLKILHASAIYRFISEFADKNKFRGLTTIVGNFTECQFDNNNENTHGLCVENTYDINYNNNIYHTIKTAKNNIKKGDIIYMVNNYPLMEGCVIDPVYGIPINFATFISLKYKSGDLINLTLFRLKKKSDDDYDNKKINVIARPIQTMKYLQISNYSDHIYADIDDKKKMYYYEFAGFTFVELTESLINDYKNKNIILRNIIENYLTLNKYRDKDISVVVAISANPSMFDTASDYKDFFPLKHNYGNEFDIGILKKINEKPINKLYDIKTYINKQSLTKMNFEFNNEFKIHMVFDKLTLLKIFFPDK